MREVLARVRFLSQGEGGRSHPPSGPSYSTVSRFPGARGTTDAWSLILDFVSQPDPSGEALVRVRFLSPDAPLELLSSGMRFELLEGPRAVARGEVVVSKLRELRDSAVRSDATMGARLLEEAW